MRIFIIALAAAVVLSVACTVVITAEKQEPTGCFIGAFFADDPTAKDIAQFKKDYGKKPYIVMIFIEWNAFIRPKIISSVYGQGSALMVTWEPWSFVGKKGIDFDRLLAGGYDDYIRKFASQLKGIKKDVYIRFAHESNGDWYPWSVARLGNEKYIAVYRHVKDIFDSLDVTNVKWVFAVNWEDIPKSNSYALGYPGDTYVDYMGIDGYNWGASQSWSRWMGFSEIFKKRYDEIAAAYKQPIMISEFSSSGAGGDKRAWIEGAMVTMRQLKRVVGFVIFNVDKETDWSFPAGTDGGKELKKQLESGYFKEL